MSISINHVLIRTRNMARMAEFFQQALDFQEGMRPPFNFPGMWLWSDNKPLIHLSELNPLEDEQADYLENREPSFDQPGDEGTGIIDHIAFSGEDYFGLISRLKQNNLKFFQRTIPASGEIQVFIQGPEGLRVEVQFQQQGTTLPLQAILNSSN